MADHQKNIIAYIDSPEKSKEKFFNACKAAFKSVFYEYSNGNSKFLDISKDQLSKTVAEKVNAEINKTLNYTEFNKETKLAATKKGFEEQAIKDLYSIVAVEKKKKNFFSRFLIFFQK